MTAEPRRPSPANRVLRSPWIVPVVMGAAMVIALAWWLQSWPRGVEFDPDDFPPRRLMRAATEAGDVSRQCRACHLQEFEDWLASQHARAQRPLAPDEGRIFTGAPVPAGQNVVPTVSGGRPGFRDRASGQFWPARAVIAIEPLRQYLLPLAGGRLQVAPLSYDPHRGDWFDAQEPARVPEDWSYWSNRGMNWNSQCAYCHMTDLQKNYSIAADSYATTWTTMGISCTQCHGDVAAHLARPEDPAANPGLAPDRVMDNCASCHARREELTGRFKPGELFADHYRLTLPDMPGIYHADGQVRDEDFEYGSLRLSRMGHAGVTCLDCHNPHSGRLKLPVENNALCMSCHSAPGQRGAVVIEPDKHMFHAAGTPGGRCTDCHMAQTTYMVRDPRRDHGFVSPDPQLTIELGIPNSCNRCHSDQSAEWARGHVDAWYGADKMESRRARKRARVVHRAQSGRMDFDPDLLAMAKDEEVAAWRATLTALLAPWRERPEVEEALRGALADADPLVRTAAVRALTHAGASPALPAAIIQDPVRLVRLEAAWQEALRGRPVPRVEELRAYIDNQSDQPAGAIKQAQWAMAREDFPAAVSWARKAADWDRTSAASRELLAMVLYSAGDRPGARQAFEAAVRLEPAQATPAFSLGLLLAEEGDLQGAMAAFEKAVAADEGFGRAWYNLGLARSQAGDAAGALAALRRAEEHSPDSADPAYALATVLLRQGRSDEARQAVRRALDRDPAHRPSRQMKAEMGW